MYRATVRFFARRTFAHLSAGRIDRFIKVFRRDSVFCFAGDHALGGEIRGVQAIRAVAERMTRLFPGFEVEPVAMIVNGWPWNTVVATRLVVRATFPDGSPYRNEGMQFLRLRWGKVVEDRVYEDTALLQAALARLEALGVAEAAAGPVPARSV
jgi:ketosteroid isomerase-like protein